MRARAFALAVASAGVLLLTGAATASARPSGAIFTTDSTGVPVNLNKYPSKEAVYLNGGPGINAPVTAAGLPDGVYSFQVTDPPGKTLLSTDPVACRQFTVSGGRIVDVIPAGACAHHTEIDQEDGGITVQLFPYLDTPNRGGVYKVWVTQTSKLNCSGNGEKFCFVPGDSKTDNWKVKSGSTVEIDTTFARYGIAGYIDGLYATWIDTNGASNVKFSEYNPLLMAFHEAHVEAAEVGTHYIVVSDQPGCTVLSATADGKTYTPVNGTVTVPVTIKNDNNDATYFVRVTCDNI